MIAPLSLVKSISLPLGDSDILNCVPVIEAPIIQPPIIQPTYQPIQQNEAVDTQPSKTLLDNNIDNNDNNDINGENLLIKNNEYSPVEPLKTNIETNEPPKPDIYDNLDSLLLSLVGE